MDSLTKEGKIVIGMVGLPARGKSYISRKICRYLNWQQISCEVFNLGEYRRQIVGTKECNSEFFNPENQDATKVREQCAALCLEDLIEYLTDDGGQVAIYDGTNSTAERRKNVFENLKERLPDVNLIWVESICSDDKVIENNIRAAKLSNRDYKDVATDIAIQDFLERINQYKKKYQELSEDLDGDASFVKLYNVGKRVVINNINGFLATKIVSFLMNLHVNPHPIYLTRSGESNYILENKMGGGDSEMTERGVKYAKLVNEFFQQEKRDGKLNEKTKILTSTLKRGVQTAQAISIGVEPHSLKILDELNCGIYNGLTLEEMEKQYPNEFKARRIDQLNYRYPSGESYLDVIHRLEPVIFEIERAKDPVIIVSHISILQCLYAYFSRHDIDRVPHLKIPSNTIIKLEPEAYFCYENRYEYDLDTSEVKEQHNPQPLYVERALKRCGSTINFIL
jgi:broad specificity phosphatase PhoE/predicted kinase